MTSLAEHRKQIEAEWRKDRSDFFHLLVMADAYEEEGLYAEAKSKRELAQAIEEFLSEP